MYNVAVSILTALRRKKKFSSSVPCVSQARTLACARVQHTHTHTQHTLANSGSAEIGSPPGAKRRGWRTRESLARQTLAEGPARGSRSLSRPELLSGRDLQIPPLERLWQLHNGPLLKVCPQPATRRPFLRFPPAPKSTRDRWGEGGGARDICRGSFEPAPGRDPQSTDATTGWPVGPQPQRPRPRPQGAARTGRAR